MNEPSRRDWAWGAFLIRVVLGLLFFVAGLGKFMGGLAGFREQIIQSYAESWLPSFIVVSFAWVLPYAEVILGALIMLGLFRFVSLVLGSLLMIALAFGMMVAQNADVLFKNIIYVALYAAAFFAAPWDVLTLDRLRAHLGSATKRG